MKTEDVVKHFRSRRRVAEHLGISTQAVYDWGETVPPLRAYELERLTGGDLRVDDAPEPIEAPEEGESPAVSDPGASDGAS